MTAPVRSPEARDTPALLHEGAETFRSAFEHSGTGMALVGLDGHWLRVNQALCRFVGYDEAELLARTSRDITHPDDVDADETLMGELLSGVRASFQLEKRYVRKDGRVVCGLLSRSLVRDETGAPRFCISQVQDVTARREAVEALARRTAELARSNAELEQFAYVASHDLQEPLRAVASYTTLLAERYRGRLDERADAWIEYAVDGARRMQALIGDLLALSRVGTRSAPFAPVNLSALLAETVGALGTAIAGSGAGVTADPLPTVLGDAIQLGELFQHLLGNALKFRRPDAPPRVHVSVASMGDDWVVTVRDDGIGVDPRFAERIFLVFKRLHTREEYPGTGVGLAICRKIIERHGGRIWVEPAEGGGAAFRFTIPRVSREAVGDEEEP